MKARWLIPLGLAVALFWVTRPTRPGFVRLPVGARPMPAWTMRDLDDRPVAATNFAGRVLVLNFWATWCPPCLAEIPDLKSFQAAHGTNGVTVLGASIDDSGAARVRSFVERNGLNYPVLLADPLVQELFGGVASVPTTFIINRDGLMVARYLGALTREELDRVVTPLLRPAVNPQP